MLREVLNHNYTEFVLNFLKTLHLQIFVMSILFQVDIYIVLKILKLCQKELHT